MDFQTETARIIARALGKSPADIVEMLETPPEGMGDIAFPCFTLAKELKKNPSQIAQELSTKIKAKYISKVETKGAYVNITIKDEVLAKQVLEQITKSHGKYGSPTLQKHKVMVEYSQPNTHKQFHIGHLRNVCLGDCIIRMKRAGGEKVISANYIGDIGAHVAKCLWCLKEFHRGEKLPENKAAYIGKIYVEAAERIEKDESLKDAVQEVQRLLETGDKEWNALWKETRQWSLDEFNSIYDRLGVKFDVFYYESQVEKEGKKIVEKLLADGIAEKSEGAVIVDLKQYGLDIFLALKRDGTSLYSTKDLALAKKKFHDYDLDESVYIVDGRQSTYFKQLFKVLELIGFKKKMVHVPYEFVSTPQGVIASRAGNVILFEDYYENARQNLVKETKERHPEWTSKKLEENASVLALAALKFWMLKHDTGSEIMFTAESALSLEGETGTYLLYVVARINSITRQAKFTKADASLLKEPEERKLVRLLWSYPQAVEQATRQLKPHIIARHLLEIAQSFNTFYHQHQVLKAEPELRNARLALIDAVRQTIENGLGLLGIGTVEEM